MCDLDLKLKIIREIESEVKVEIEIEIGSVIQSEEATGDSLRGVVASADGGARKCVGGLNFGA